MSKKEKLEHSKTSKSKIIIALIILIIILCAVAIGVFAYTKQAKNIAEKDIYAKSKNIITVDGKKFKDLNGNGEVDIYEDWQKSSEERAENLISQMTLEEKAGMVLINTQTMGVDQENKELTSNDGILDEEETQSGTQIYLNKTGNTKTITELNLRHIILRTGDNVEDIAKWTNTMQQLAEESRLGIPILITSNSRNELADEQYTYNLEATTKYPGTLGIAAATLGEIKYNGSSNIIENFAEVVNKEFKALGIRKGYMYNCDIGSDPRWFRYAETFGEDTDFITDTMTKLITGIQGTTLDRNGVALTLKHFPGSGPRDNGQDAHFEKGKYAIYVTENSLQNYHLKPYEAAIKAGVSSIMPYYSLPSEESAVQTYNGEIINMAGSAFAFNAEFLNNLLREKMGFEGYINTDSGVIDYIYWGEEGKTEEERVAAALNAGTDLISDTNKVQTVISAYNQKLITDETLNTACKRVLIEMFDLGLFENPYVNEYEDVASKEEATEEAYQTHLKSVTLLKNKENCLPLTEEKVENKKVFVRMLGSFSDYSFEDELREKIQSDFSVEVTENYEEADYAILYLCPSSMKQINRDYTELQIDGTSFGIGNLELYQKICNAIHNNNGKVITVINFKNPWILENIEPYTDGLFATYNTYSKAWLDVIFGKFNPTGVLPFTLPANDAVLAVDENGNCISPNDVPGYDKNKYLPDGMKYEYTDSEGNSYTLKFGLTY